MQGQDPKRERSYAATMALELKPWRPRFPKLSIWLYSKPYGFHISAFYYATFAILLVALGVLLSSLLDDGLWLSRLGSLVIVVGILFGVHGVEGKIDSDIWYCSEMLKAIEQDEFESKKDTFDGSFEKTPEHVGEIVVHSFSQAFSGKREENWGNRIKRNTLRYRCGNCHFWHTDMGLWRSPCVTNSTIVAPMATRNNQAVNRSGRQRGI